LFIWLSLLSGIFLFIQSAIVWSILKRRHRDFNRYSVLNEDDDDDEIDVEERTQNSNNHQLKSLKTNNGNAAINLNNSSKI
jgi:hypothetical protein